MKTILIILLIIPLYLNANATKESFKELNIQAIEQQKNLNNFKEIFKIEMLKTKEVRANLINQNLALKKEILEIKEKYRYQNKINELTMDSVSIQLTASSNNLTVFGILFGFSALIFGIYITYIEGKIVKISEKNTIMLSKSKVIKDEVESINKLIQKDIHGLFIKIKREETLNILNRLVKVPKDISNLIETLLSRELEKEDYFLLKKAFIGVLDSTEDKYKDDYKLVFFQHFLDLIIKDNDIGSELISFYDHGIHCSFENDVLKSTRDFVKGISDITIVDKENHINSFFAGLSDSDYKNDKEIYEIFFDGLYTKENRFQFFDLLANTANVKIGKDNFAKLISNKYTGDNDLTEHEQSVINTIIV